MIELVANYMQKTQYSKSLSLIKSQRFLRNVPINKLPKRSAGFQPAVSPTCSRHFRNPTNDLFTANHTKRQIATS
jgi:hypothetical protein